MKMLKRICTAVLYSASAVLLLTTMGQTASAQAVTFSPAEKQVILPPGAGAASGVFGNVAADASGNIFFINGAGGSVTKLSPNGTVTTISSGLNFPDEVKTDAAGNVYAADNGTNELIKITPGGVQTVVASGLNLGTDVQGLTFDFRDFAVDGNGNIFISDNPASQVVKVSPSGVQTVLTSGFAPWNIMLDSSGNIFITDLTNNRVVQIAPSGVQTVFTTGLNNPNGLALDSSGNVYVAQSEGQCCVNSEIVQITPAGVKTRLYANAVQFAEVAVDGAGNIFTNTDTGILEFRNTATTKGEVTFGNSIAAGPGSASPVVQPITFQFNSTVTVGSIQVLTNGAPSQDFQSVSGGTCGAGTFSSGQTCIVNAQFVPIQAGARLGAVVLSDSLGNALSTVDLNGFGSLPAAALNPAALKSVLSTGLLDPSAVAVDGLGNTFIVDKGHSRVVKLSSTGTQTVLGNGLASPTGVAEDGAGNIYITDTANDRVVEVTPNGVQTTILSGLNTPEGIAVDGAGNLYVADAGNDRVLRLANDGVTQSAVGSGYARPTGVAVDGFGNVFVADFGNNQIVEVTPSGAQSTVIGNLSSPSGVTVDAVGNLYIAEVGANTVIEVTPGTSPQITVITSGLNFPFDAVLVAVNGSGSVFIADTFNNRVLQVDRSQSNLDFGTVAKGQTVTKIVTISSVGPRVFTLQNGITLASGGPSFQLVQTTSNDCLQTRGLHGSCNLTVSFTPNGQSAFTGTVTIHDLAGTQVVHLTGLGN